MRLPSSPEDRHVNHLAAHLRHRNLRERDTLEQAVIGFLLRLSNQNTFREYQRDLKNFLAWCTDQPIDPLSVRRLELTAYLRTLERRGHAEATVSRKFGTVRTWLRYCADEELIGKDPPAASTALPSTGTSKSAPTSTSSNGRSSFGPPAVTAPPLTPWSRCSA